MEPNVPRLPHRCNRHYEYSREGDCKGSGKREEGSGDLTEEDS
jgi:hypothetical protein